MRKEAHLALFIFTLMFFNSGISQKSANPLFDGAWYADPEVAILNNQYWIFPTYSADFDNQVYMDAFSSNDLTHWKKHPRIIDTSMFKWAKRALWAPAIVAKDKKYYLFFGANDLQTPESKWWDPKKNSLDDVGGIGIAVADEPEGPYRDYLGKPLIGKVYNGAQPIDQFIFKDTDGQYYIIYGGWGHCNIAKLNDDFTGMVPFDDGETYKEITPENYVEGSVMFMRNGKYYFMWSEGTWTNNTYKVAYAISDSLLGPFQRIGAILESDPKIATGAGHHSVMNIPGTDDWYIVYHRRPIPNEGRDDRVTCIDRMYFNTDGTIKPVIMTFEGVEARPLKQKR